MPITEQTTVNSYTGNGVTTVFPYTFKIFASSDLKVTVDGVLKTINTDYTVSGVGASGGGNVTFVNPPLNLAAVTIYREMPYSRTTDFVDNGDLLAQTLDDDLDRDVMLLQQVKRDIKRAIKFPVEETTDQGFTENAASRANKVMMFNAAGALALAAITDLDATNPLITIGAGLQLSGGDLSVTKPTRVATAGGTVDALTATFSPAITSLTNGLRVLVEAPGVNASATPTFAPDGLAAKTIVKGSGEALLVGDIRGANFWADLVYDDSLDKWVLMNPYGLFAIEHNTDGTHKTNYSPAGIILPYGGTVAPSGWLLCYGQAVSRTTYAGLFAVLSTTFGVGDGATTFNVPDLRGRFQLGKDDMGGASADRVQDAQADILGGGNGTETHTLSVAEMPAHAHTTPTKTGAGQTAGADQDAINGAGVTGSAGDGAAHNNMPPFITLNYIVKT